MERHLWPAPAGGPSALLPSGWKVDADDPQTWVIVDSETEQSASSDRDERCGRLSSRAMQQRPQPPQAPTEVNDAEGRAAAAPPTEEEEEENERRQQQAAAAAPQRGQQVAPPEGAAETPTGGPADGPACDPAVPGEAAPAAADQGGPAAVDESISASKFLQGSNAVRAARAMWGAAFLAIRAMCAMLQMWPDAGPS